MALATAPLARQHQGLSRRAPHPSDSAVDAWELRVLGPTELVRSGVPVPMRPQGRVLLCWVVLHPDGLDLGRLVELAWGYPAPTGAARQVTELLRVGSDSPVAIADGRLRLDRPAVRVDEDEFTSLLTTCDERACLEAALALWRGDPYADLNHHPDALPAIHRLERRRDDALSSLYSLRLLEPEVARTVADLSAQSVLRPGSSRLRQLLAAGLALSGRRVEALRTVQAATVQDPTSRSWATRLEAAIQSDDVELMRRLVAEMRI